MENENYEISDYSFLSEESVERHLRTSIFCCLVNNDHKYYAEYTVLEAMNHSGEIFIVAYTGLILLLYL